MMVNDTSFPPHRSITDHHFCSPWLDIAEEEPLDVAVIESERLRRAMYEEHDDEPVADNGYGLRIKRFRDIRNRMQAIDPVGWVEVRDDTEEWFHIEKKLGEFESLEEYLEVRKIHVGNKCVCQLQAHFLILVISLSEI
jgi:hypothetical protein